MDSSGSNEADDRWGRVAEDGTVYVRSGAGERSVGQWPDGDPAEALAFFQKRYEGLAFEIELLEQRVKAGKLSPEDATASVKKVRTAVTEAQVVGDLDGLHARLDALNATIAERREQRKIERAKRAEAAQASKERLVAEAERLSEGTDWRHGAVRMRTLLDEWKAAGSAAKTTDDHLWARFRGAQDKFFGARDAANAEAEAELVANAGKKDALLSEAEALLPVQDLQAAKDAFRGIAERWDAAGKVPRERTKELEGRMRKVEKAIRGVEDDRWTSSNPEARARAADTVAQLESSIQDLQAQHDKAVAAGDTKSADEHSSSIEARRAWLVEAKKALDDFSV